MQEERPDSEQLLKRLKYEEREQEKRTRGRLKIFLGYAAGSGKTYAMLEAAHEAKKHQVILMEAMRTAFDPGLKKLEDELHDLKVNKRREIAGKIKEAREQGDLSENAEYDAAKDEQRDIEARIEEIEKILKNAEVVVEDEVDSDKINIGCKVDVLDLEYDEEIEFQIVGSTEANSLEGKISNESPVGKALIGAHKDDIVDVETPAGIMQYKVLSIQRNI